eukprot:8169337-Heterocapsa_arctica.AAC.1
MRAKLKNDRSQRWRNWVENSWGHNKKYNYKWIRGKTGNGPLIVSNGGESSNDKHNETYRRNLGRLMGGRCRRAPQIQ